MSVLLVLILAAVICGIMWRRPGARAAAAGAWQAGRQQAALEFRQGYDWAQARLRVGDPKPYNPRRWASWALAAGFGAVKTAAAAGRIGTAAYRGARDRHEAWRLAQPVDAEVIDESQDEPERKVPDVHSCAAGCGSIFTRRRDDLTLPGWYCHPCAVLLLIEQQPDTQPHQEEPMQTEAAGLTSYAAAHTELATELRTRMSAIENLRASMAPILAEHSDLIGDTAVIQDLLNQAAALAEALAAKTLTVANN